MRQNHHFDTTFPPSLGALLALGFDHDTDGVDLEPYESFMDAEENASWIGAWTGNESLNAAAYRFFGQDGTGGLAGFWLVRDGVGLLEQPVVFFGSEGEVGVVARDFGNFLWLLASGAGPYEAVAYGAEDGKGLARFRAFARQHAPEQEKSGADVLRAARDEFPTFSEEIAALCG